MKRYEDRQLIELADILNAHKKLWEGTEDEEFVNHQVYLAEEFIKSIISNTQFHLGIKVRKPIKGDK